MRRLTSTIVAASRDCQLSVGFANVLPVVDVGDVHARAHYIFEASTRALEGQFGLFLRICMVCAYGSPMPTIWPLASVAVVPAMCTVLPTRTARE